MRRSVLSYLKLSGPAIFLLFLAAAYPTKGLAQQAHCDDASPISDSLVSRSNAEKPGARVPSGPPAVTHPDPHSAPMCIEPGLVLAPGQSVRDARKSFEKAARRGNTNAEVKLAILYLYGWGARQNFGTGLYWLKTAADQGNSRASTDLGLLYWKGWGVRADSAEALRYFLKAAELGETEAMVDFGYMNDYGIGTAVDHAAAAQWYRRGAERGDAMAQNNLADLYLRGEGVPQNDEIAFAWFQKAALQGNTGARIKLGFLYANGRATRKDLEIAYAWILAASMAGDHRGQIYLAELEAQLSPEQNESARRRAEELQSSPSTRANNVALIH